MKSDLIDDEGLDLMTDEIEVMDKYEPMVSCISILNVAIKLVEGNKKQGGCLPLDIATLNKF